MLRAFDPFSSWADHLDCPHSHSLGTDEQMGLLAVWQSLRYQCCPHDGHLALVHAWCSTLAGWAGIRRTGIPGRTLTWPGLVRPLLVEIKFRPGAKGPALSLGGEKLR